MEWDRRSAFHFLVVDSTWPAVQVFGWSGALDTPHIDGIEINGPAGGRVNKVSGEMGEAHGEMERVLHY